MPAILWLVGGASLALGFVPGAFVAFCARQKLTDSAYWWLSAAFAVSIVSDTWSIGALLRHHTLLGHAFVERIYPVVQCSLVANVVLLDRRDKELFLWTLCLIACVGLVNPMPNDDVLLRSVAFLGVAGLVCRLPSLGRLRTALLAYFWLGWVAWLVYAIHPGVPSYLAYQMTRVLGIALFCSVVQCDRPRLRILRAA